jgi:hypothetical protein
MSTPYDVLKRARAAGVEIIPDGDQLRLRANAAPPRELLDELRAHKPALLRLLTQPDEATPSEADPAERIGAWLAVMDRLPKACGPYGQRLRAITTDFALSCWAYEAVRLGWTDADLFDLDCGLIPEMSRRALHFRSIGEDALCLINGRGEYEEWERRDMTDAAPWWEDERCVARFH